MNNRQAYLQALAKVEKAARGNHFQRLAIAPARYLWGMLHSKLLYPISGSSRRQQAPLFFGGSMEVLLPAGLDIYLLGAKSHDSEIRLARFMIQHLGKEMGMLDVGAHFGFFSRLGAALVEEGGSVLAVEAAGSTYEVLQRNVAGQSSIEAIRAAASDEEGTATFYEFPALYSEYNTLEKGQFEDAEWRKSIHPRAVQVPAYRMDTLIGQQGLLVHFIKIDVEGAEAQVAAGLSNWFSSPSARWLAMEFLAAERHNEGHLQAAGYLAEYGWRPFSIQEDGSLVACPDIEAYLERRGLDSDNIVFQPEVRPD